MASYYLLQNETTIPSPVPVSFFKSVQPWGPTNPTSPPSEQTFQLTVSTPNGIPCTASAQVVVSNDNSNWSPYGDPISATNLVPGQFGGTQAWRHFSAYITAISGTGTQASLRMNA